MRVIHTRAWSEVPTAVMPMLIVLALEVCAGLMLMEEVAHLFGEWRQQLPRGL